VQAIAITKQMNRSNTKALKRAREVLGISRKELAQRIGLTYKTIEKYENGRCLLDEVKIRLLVDGLKISKEEFNKIKRGKKIKVTKRIKNVLSNLDRRSYKRIITKEVRVLRILRQQKRINQYQASKICGYSKPTIGHIENGRIEIPQERIKHIVISYGHTMDKFFELMKENVLRDEIIKECYVKIVGLTESKLKLVQSVLENL
jgi:transcriptional regulator with XRE-family HTH domain